jgi:hypothetical protein
MRPGNFRIFEKLESIHFYLTKQVFYVRIINHSFINNLLREDFPPNKKPERRRGMKKTLMLLVIWLGVFVGNCASAGGIIPIQTDAYKADGKIKTCLSADVSWEEDLADCSGVFEEGIPFRVAFVVSDAVAKEKPSLMIEIRSEKNALLKYRYSDFENLPYGFATNAVGVWANLPAGHYRVRGLLTLKDVYEYFETEIDVVAKPPIPQKINESNFVIIRMNGRMDVLNLDDASLHIQFNRHSFASSIVKPGEYNHMPGGTDSSYCQPNNDVLVSVASVTNDSQAADFILEDDCQAIISFKPGWQLLSVPFRAANALDEFSKFATSIWRWRNGGWEISFPGNPELEAEYAAEKGFKKLTSVDPGTGFWVNSPKGGVVSLSIDKQ